MPGLLDLLFRCARDTFWGLRLDEAPPPASPPDRVAFRAASKEDAAPLSTAMGERVEVVLERMERGSRCFVGEQDGQIVTYCWSSCRQEEIGDLERQIHLVPGEAYIWDCQTLPARRGRGLYPRLLRIIAERLRNEGHRLVWIAADAGNQASIRGFQKAGFTRIADVLYLRILFLRWTWFSRGPGAPRDLFEQARRVMSRQ